MTSEDNWPCAAAELLGAPLMESRTVAAGNVDVTPPPGSCGNLG